MCLRSNRTVKRTSTSPIAYNRETSLRNRRKWSSDTAKMRSKKRLPSECTGRSPCDTPHKTQQGREGSSSAAHCRGESTWSERAATHVIPLEPHAHQHFQVDALPHAYDGRQQGADEAIPAKSTSQGQNGTTVSRSRRHRWLRTRSESETKKWGDRHPDLSRERQAAHWRRAATPLQYGSATQESVRRMCTSKTSRTSWRAREGTDNERPNEHSDGSDRKVNPFDEKDSYSQLQQRKRKVLLSQVQLIRTWKNVSVNGNTAFSLLSKRLLITVASMENEYHSVTDNMICE